MSELGPDPRDPLAALAGDGDAVRILVEDRDAPEDGEGQGNIFEGRDEGRIGSAVGRADGIAANGDGDAQ